jgi:DNA-binding beta-propeller fold protein YncE
MHKTFFFSLVILLVFIQGLIAQTNFLDSRNAYLGQALPGDTPKVFAPGILAGKGEFSANRTAISADGREIYYCTNTTWANDQNLKVKYFKYDGKKWIGPIILNKYLEAAAFSPDNNTLYFTSDDTANVVFRANRTKTGWGPTTWYLERNYIMYDFMPSKSGNKYVASNGTWAKPSDFNGWRFSIMPATDADTSIRNLDMPLNSPGFNGDFFIDQDESYMIVTTKLSGQGEGELYISFRKKDKTWTTPESLGPLINDGAAHRYGQYVSPDGKYLFYTRGTSGNEKECAIYWVKFDRLLKKLKPANL